MLRRALTAIISLAICLPAHAQTTAVAVPCSLLTTGDAAVQANGVVVPLPAWPADCRALRVLHGEVVACLGDSQGEPVCRSFALGETIDPRRFGPAGGHTPPAALERLLRGSPGAAPGQWRGADPLLPNKTVLLLEGRLLVDFSEPDMQGVESVEIRGDSIDGPLLATAARTPGPTAIEAGSLSVGRNYWAVLVPSQRPTQAPKRFTVAPPQEQQLVRERLRAFEHQQAGPLATAMMRAAWLAQQNYDYDALVTMKSIGMRTR
ncbi:MAG: hypothetical protein ACRC2B_13265 [Rubrivivax sp.]